MFSLPTSFQSMSLTLVIRLDPGVKCFSGFFSIVWEQVLGCISNATVTGFIFIFFIFNVDDLWSHYWMLQYCFCFMFWVFGHRSRGVPCIRRRNLNHWTTRKSHRFAFTRDLHIKCPPARPLSWGKESWRKHSTDLEHGPPTVRDSLAIWEVPMKLNEWIWIEFLW